MHCFFESIPENCQVIPVIPIVKHDFPAWVGGQTDSMRNWIKVNGFCAKSSSFCLIPNEAGDLAQVLLGLDSPDDFWAFGILPSGLNCDALLQIAAPEFTKDQLEHALIAFGLGSYSFGKYKKNASKKLKILISPVCDKANIVNTVSSIYLIRDLINTPAEDMNPQALAEVAEKLAASHGATYKQVIGDDLLKNNFPGVHLVGRASSNSPRLVEFQWGDLQHKKITLVGKGVCFDSGGLNIKPTQGMETMKKDMGGAAHILGLAQMIMMAKLPVNLRVIIPLVENVISGSSYKPGDVVTMRNGLTIEITNTDAEGRVILADALVYACEDNPDLLLDFATLTGAARIALGTELPAMFCNDKSLCEEIFSAFESIKDPIWWLPLFSPYRDMLDSQIADMKNCSASSYGGAITAALFLQEFIEKHITWIHFDIMGSNVKTRPGRPEGGEAVGVRGMFNYIRQKYCNESIRH